MLGNNDNGRWQVAPLDGVREVNRRYRGETLILEKTFTTASGEIAWLDVKRQRGWATPAVSPARTSPGIRAARKEVRRYNDVRQ